MIHHIAAMQLTTARLGEANTWLCRQRRPFPPDANLWWFRRCRTGPLITLAHMTKDLGAQLRLLDTGPDPQL